MFSKKKQFATQQKVTSPSSKEQKQSVQKTVPWDDYIKLTERVQALEAQCIALQEIVEAQKEQLDESIGSQNQFDHNINGFVHEVNHRAINEIGLLDDRVKKLETQPVRPSIQQSVQQPANLPQPAALQGPVDTQEIKHQSVKESKKKKEQNRNAKEDRSRNIVLFNVPEEVLPNQILDTFGVSGYQIRKFYRFFPRNQRNNRGVRNIE